MKPYQFLQTLLNTPSPSGFETRGQKVWVVDGDCPHGSPRTLRRSHHG